MLGSELRNPNGRYETNEEETMKQWHNNKLHYISKDSTLYKVNEGAGGHLWWNMLGIRSFPEVGVYKLSTPLHIHVCHATLLVTFGV